MPVYEYECGACGHQFEQTQRITEPPIKTCPECQKDEVQRLISRTSFHLKGGGWYSDLYASSKGKDAKAEGKADKSEAKSDTKAETKTETKTEAKSDKPAAKSDAGAAKPSSGSGGAGSGSGGVKAAALK
jgi:putative FmdB family regulatory protein